MPIFSVIPPRHESTYLALSTIKLILKDYKFITYTKGISVLLKHFAKKFHNTRHCVHGTYNVAL